MKQNCLKTNNFSSRPFLKADLGSNGDICRIHKDDGAVLSLKYAPKPRL